MTFSELDLLLIRQREHEIWSLHLRKDAYKLEGGTEVDEHWMDMDSAILDLLNAKDMHIQQLEGKGIEYFTITAEMARIRAEVRGEK